MGNIKDKKRDRFIFSVAGFYWFRPYGELLSLYSLRSPFGPACGCYYASLRMLVRKRK